MAASGVFATWQPVYAEHGIPTFPVVIEAGKKRPAVSSYLKVGQPASRQLASKFGANKAFGFGVKRAGLTILDVDTRDERVLAEALHRHGQTPIIVRSGGGNFQAWYRHNDEPRRIRPWPDMPIDVLGGGFVVAPPSMGQLGSYDFIQGSLEDLSRLPSLQGVDSLLLRPGRALPAIHQGNRNDMLFRHLMKQARACDDLEALADVAETYAERFIPPLPREEILRTAQSVWGYELRGENRFSRGHFIEVLHSEVDTLLLQAPDAFVLKLILRRRHWLPSATFMVANRMASIMPGGGWTEKRLAAARRELIFRGELRLVRRAAPGKPATFAWGKTGQK